MEHPRAHVPSAACLRYHHRDVPPEPVLGRIRHVPPLGLRARARHGRRQQEDPDIPLCHAGALDLAATSLRRVFPAAATATGPLMRLSPTDDTASAHHDRPCQDLQTQPGAGERTLNTPSVAVYPSLTFSSRLRAAILLARPPLRLPLARRPICSTLISHRPTPSAAMIPCNASSLDTRKAPSLLSSHRRCNLHRLSLRKTSRCRDAAGNSVRKMAERRRRYQEREKTRGLGLSRGAGVCASEASRSTTRPSWVCLSAGW